jgi:hypothetical protein
MLANGYGEKAEHVQWKRCLESVSLGMYSATSSLSSPSAQHPMRLTRRLCRTFPTPVASACSNTLRHIARSGRGSNQTEQASNQRGPYEELLRVGPGEAREALDGDEPPPVEAAAVDDVGRLLAALRYDEVGAEALGGGAQLGQRELPERRYRPLRRVLVIAVAPSVRSAVRRLCDGFHRKQCD